MADQPERIPQHRHCRSCGKAFVGDGEFCGDVCKSSAGKDAKKKLRKLGFIWLAIVAATAVVIGIYYFQG
jgi:predicted nucleic acid-binding Zn ribbon protein